MARSGAIAGILSVLLFLIPVGGLELIATPGGQDSNARYAEEISKNSEQIRTLIGVYLAIAGVLAFGWFVTVLVRRIETTGTLRELTGVAGSLLVVVSGLLIVGLAAMAALPLSAQFGKDADVLPADAGRIAWIGLALIFLAAPLVHAALVAVISVAVIRTRVLPAWTAWVGFLVAFLMLFGLAWAPLISLPIWIICMSVMLWIRPNLAATSLRNVPVAVA